MAVETGVKTKVFEASEIQGFHRLINRKQVLAGNIRGPYEKWELIGNPLCGDYTSINGDFTARGRVFIGKYCAFGRYVALLSGNHRTDMPNQQIWFNKRFGFQNATESKGPIEIGHNVWIGDKVSVLSGVSVGHGAVIAAGSTVAKDVAPFSIVGGNPAKPIRSRFSPGVIDQMLALQWWHWDDAKVARNKAFFELSIAPDDDIDLSKIVSD